MTGKETALMSLSAFVLTVAKVKRLNMGNVVTKMSKRAQIGHALYIYSCAMGTQDIFIVLDNVIC